MSEKRVRKKRSQRRVTLFLRIMMHVTFPLLALIAVFSAIQLANEMRVLNESYHLRSRFAFESIHRTLDLAVRQTQDLRNPSVLAPLAKQLEEIHQGVSINAFDLLEGGLVLAQKSAWREPDAKALEESLYQKQQGKPSLIKIRRGEKRLISYVPLEDRSGNIFLVARIEFALADLGDALAASRWRLITMALLIMMTGIAIGRRLSLSIVKPIQTLNDATREIVKGTLGKHVHIDTRDEIEDLAHTFNKMSDSLKEMKQKAQDSNPLTGLPGNQGIFQEVKKRLHERQKFVLFHTDLDRFKVFNDHFGLGKGDEAIKKTADLLMKAREEAGSKDDFIGHQGGDDFVIITKPNTAVLLAEYITKTFDTEVVKGLYPQEDFERGYTLQLDRRRLAETGEEIMTKFPLLALSLAGVSNVKKDFADYFDCMSTAVVVKKEVKKAIESSYLIKE